MQRQQLNRANYQQQNAGINFNPVEVVDYATEQERNIQRQEQDRQQYLSRVQQSDKVRVKNAGQYGEDLKSFLSLSQTLTKRLIEDQKERDKQSMTEGIYEEFMSPSDTTPLIEQENQLREADAAINGMADQAEREGLDVVRSQEIRETSGWRAYGRAIGRVMRGAAEYTSYVQMARQTTTVTIVGPDGIEKEIGYHIDGGPKTHSEKSSY